MTGTATGTATVEVLTAEVRTLMVGSRQVTLSVFRQLDTVGWDECEPFGRVNDPKNDLGVNVVGRHQRTGALVRVWCPNPYDDFLVLPDSSVKETHRDLLMEFTECMDLPLIVLAGLR